MNFPENISTILFDMDGVIADAEPLWDDIDATLLAHHGVTYNGEHKHQVMGKSFPLSVTFYRDHFKLSPTLEDLMEERRIIAAEFYRNRIEPFPHAAQVLEALRERGLQIGLATSSVSDCALPFLERHNLRHWFDAVTTGEEVQHGKPNPDIYLLAARKLDAAPENCLVVEDSLPGVQAGKSAGMLVAAIPGRALR
jgi:HAD superfamily hydrolase (TIGR01509 family)